MRMGLLLHLARMRIGLPYTQKLRHKEHWLRSVTQAGAAAAAQIRNSNEEVLREKEILSLYLKVVESLQQSSQTPSHSEGRR